jgi:hypothetical protein
MNRKWIWFQVSPERFAREKSILRALPYFSLGREYFEANVFNAVGQLQFVGRRSGIAQRFRIRLQYPDRFPDEVQAVYDHDELFEPGLDGHLPKHRLCLSLPERQEFSLGSDRITEEVLGATLVWFHKRQIYERNGHLWPGLAEKHGDAARIDLILERCGLLAHKKAGEWANSLYEASRRGGHIYLDIYAPCICGSGKKLKFCHLRGLKGLTKICTTAREFGMTILK